MISAKLQVRPSPREMLTFGGGGGNMRIDTRTLCAMRNVAMTVQLQGADHESF